jgi:hypothetical protein
MSPLGLVELQGVSDAVDDAVRDAGGVAALQPGVVLARDACEESDLVAAQARDPPAVSAEHRKPACSGVILARLVVRNSRISPRTSPRMSRLCPMPLPYERIGDAWGPCQ